MSDAIKLGKIPSFRRGSKSLFTEAGRAGPRRLVVISCVGVSFIALAVALTLSGRHKPQFSFDARMKAVDALPGGLHSSPEQDALAYRADTEQAQNAQLRGKSYTPPIAPGVTVTTAFPQAEQPAPAAPEAPAQPHFVGRPARVYPATVVIPAPTVIQPRPGSRHGTGASGDTGRATAERRTAAAIQPRGRGAVQPVGGPATPH